MRYGSVKKCKFTVSSGILIFIVVAFAGLMWWAMYALTPPDKNRMQRYFHRDRESIETVVKYLEESGYYKVQFHKTMGRGEKLADLERLSITDKAVTKAVDRLLRRRRYRIIVMNGNTIYFDKWSMGGKNYGIAYSINGTDKPRVPFPINIEPLSEDGWYYYEEDYNEWRARNR